MDGPSVLLASSWTVCANAVALRWLELEAADPPNTEGDFVLSVYKTQAKRKRLNSVNVRRISEVTLAHPTGGQGVLEEDANTFFINVADVSSGLVRSAM